LLAKTKHTKLVILIDPDKYNSELIELANNLNVSYIFVGGSVLKKHTFEKTIKSIKSLTKIPIIIFPGDENQISNHADGILLLSLISGRNPEYLIGKHVLAAKKIKDSKLTVIPTGYILVHGDKKSTTQKVTHTKPLNKPSEIIATAIAGELIGKHLIYLEAGSGAKKTITPSLIASVKKNISIPLIIGGGINTLEKAKSVLKSNPDYMVIGNALESNPDFLTTIGSLFKK
jgi:phosphoglycerol geranylgeranyltransferase